MARKFVTPIDLGKLELQNAVIQNLASAPSSPVEGQLYYDTVSHALFVRLNSGWQQLGAAIATGSVTNAMLADMAQSTIKGRTAGAGTGVPVDLTVAQVKTILALAAADISGFDTQVRTNRLDQMTAPTASVLMNSQQLKNLLDPTASQDAVTKSYVDAMAAGLDWKLSVRVASTANVANRTTDLQAGAVIDGVTLADGDRVLLKDQSTGSQNGIYVANTSGGRANDADQSVEVTSGLAVFVEEGTVNADTGWVLTTNNPITLATTALVFTQFTSLGQITAGAGLTKTGNSIDVAAGTGISTSGDVVSVDSTVARIYAVDCAAASSTTVTHGLTASKDKIVQVFRVASPYDQVEVDVAHTSTTTLTVTFAGTAPSAGDYRIVVMG